VKNAKKSQKDDITKQHINIIELSMRHSDHQQIVEDFEGANIPPG